MLEKISLALLLSAATNVAAFPARLETRAVSDAIPQRPNITIGPYKPYRNLTYSPPRNRTCVVAASGNGTDDAPAVMSAFQSCNNGGSVVLSANTTYTIGTAMNLTFLKHVDWVIAGTMKFTNDTNYWQKNGFNQTFQNATTFFQLGGEDVNVYGGGTIDGNGQVWYDLYAQNVLILRPVLFGTVGLKGGSISNLKFRYSPQYYNWVANSTDVVFSDIDIEGTSTSKNVAKNTDGWDTYRSSNIVIQNSHINNGDDCVSFKPNSTEIIVQNMWCNGSHGISVGSLGQYKGETDIVENIYVYNVSMSNASDGARIKVWPGTPSALAADLQGGGGGGRVNNITYDSFKVSNVDYAIEITQCYGQSNFTLCNQFPSNLTISNVLIQNFTGTTSTKYSPLVGSVVCSSPSTCNNITIKGINVVSPNNTNGFACNNINKSGLMINCTTSMQF